MRFDVDKVVRSGSQWGEHLRIVLGRSIAVEEAAEVAVRFPPGTEVLVLGPTDAPLAVALDMVMECSTRAELVQVLEAVQGRLQHMPPDEAPPVEGEAEAPGSFGATPLDE